MVETCLKRVETDFRTDFEMGTIQLNYDYHELESWSTAGRWQ